MRQHTCCWKDTHFFEAPQQFMMHADSRRGWISFSAHSRCRKECKASTPQGNNMSGHHCRDQSTGNSIDSVNSSILSLAPPPILIYPSVSLSTSRLLCVSSLLSRFPLNPREGSSLFAPPSHSTLSLFSHRIRGDHSSPLLYHDGLASGLLFPFLRELRVLRKRSVT